MNRTLNSRIAEEIHKTPGLPEVKLEAEGLIEREVTSRRGGSLIEVKW